MKQCSLQYKLKRLSCYARAGRAKGQTSSENLTVAKWLANLIEAVIPHRDHQSDSATEHNYISKQCQTQVREAHIVLSARGEFLHRHFSIPPVLIPTSREHQGLEMTSVILLMYNAIQLRNGLQVFGVIELLRFSQRVVTLPGAAADHRFIDLPFAAFFLTRQFAGDHDGAHAPRVRPPANQSRQPDSRARGQAEAGSQGRARHRRRQARPSHD